MRRPDGAAADVERRRDDPVGPQLLQREHGTDDVDDRIEGTDLVQMHPVERCPVNAGLDLAQAVKQLLGARLPLAAQRRAVDEPTDLGQAAVMAVMPLLMCVGMGPV